jgi:hypothetical protein
VADGGKTRTFLFSMETPSMSPPISPCVRDDSNFGVKDDKQSSPRSPKPPLKLKDDKQSSPRTSIPKFKSKDDANLSVRDDANLSVRDDANLSVVEKRRQMSLDGATDLASITSSCDALKMKTELPGKKVVSFVEIKNLAFHSFLKYIIIDSPFLVYKL